MKTIPDWVFQAYALEHNYRYTGMVDSSTARFTGEHIILAKIPATAVVAHLRKLGYHIPENSD